MVVITISSLPTRRNATFSLSLFNPIPILNSPLFQRYNRILALFNHPITKARPEGFLVAIISDLFFTHECIAIFWNLKHLEPDGD